MSALWAPGPIEFSRQDCWTGVPFPTPGDPSWPRDQNRISPSPALAGGFFTISAPCDSIDNLIKEEKSDFFFFRESGKESNWKVVSQKNTDLMIWIALTSGLVESDRGEKRTWDPESALGLRWVLTARRVTAHSASLAVTGMSSASDTQRS